MAMRIAMTSVLTTCCFANNPPHDYLIDIKGLDSWTAFTSLDFSDFSDIAKQAPQHTTPFTIDVIKVKA